jgi:hypothetical protein
MRCRAAWRAAAERALSDARLMHISQCIIYEHLLAGIKICRMHEPRRQDVSAIQKASALHIVNGVQIHNKKISI